MPSHRFAENHPDCKWCLVRLHRERARTENHIRWPDGGWLAIGLLATSFGIGILYEVLVLVARALQ